MDLSLALCLSILLAAPADNLDFGAGTFSGWEGKGFRLVEETGRKSFGATSSDGDTPGHTGRLERSVTVPAGVAFLRCRAYAVYGAGAKPESKLDMLLTAGGQTISKYVHTADDWRPAAALLPARAGQPLEYSWPVAAHAGKPLRLVLLDDDARPGCHLYCSGFLFLTRADAEAREFSRHMVGLQRQHKLNAMARYDTAHFTALSNAEEEFSKARLQNCEMLYRRFFEHFRKKGFPVREPATRLMVAIFDTEAGFKAYVGPNENRGAQGIYDTRTNRLVIYDYRENRQFQAQRQKAADAGKRLLQLDRDQYLGTLDRMAREFATDQNLSLIIHEVAHQLSFNGGLFNRQGDSPFWIVEGLACYCEPAENGVWLGLGKPNPDRLRSLTRAKGQLVPLRTLVTGDGWKAGGQHQTLLFYAQSWVLFQLLMEERPQALREYLRLIYPRQTPDHRWTDFRQAFGADVEDLEKRLGDYVRLLVERHGPPRQ